MNPDVSIEGARTAVVRQFDVAAPVEHVWDVLAEVEDWPQWAPHIRRVEVHPSGPLGPESSGLMWLRPRMRATFRMATWEPRHRWMWVGRAGGLTVHYDHRFDSTQSGTATALTWVVGLSGFGSRLLRRPFSRAYGRNVDRAIPRLRALIEGGATRRPDSSADIDR